MTEPNEPQSKRRLGFLRLGLWAGFWFALSLAIFVIALPNLPDVVAIHWNGSGQPDGSAPIWMVPVGVAISIAIGLLLSLQFRIQSEPSMEAFAIVGMLGGVGLSIALLTAVANWGISDWTDAAPLTVWSVILVFVIPLLGLLVGIVIGRNWYPIKDLPRQRDGSDTTATELERGERVSWVGRARVRWLSLVMFGLGLVLLFTFPDLPLWILLPVVGLGLVFTQVEANVTNDGVRVRLGGITVRKVPLESISSARPIDLEPAEWGGWGWRFAPGRSAIVLRRGEALELTFGDGRRFAITVDTPAEGAALINGLVDLREQL